MIKVASAPVSWGIYEFEGIEPKFPYSQVLDEIAESLREQRDRSPASPRRESFVFVGALRRALSKE